jgi:simple sugar transport system ATP-binding protein
VSPPFVTMRGIVKTFGAVRALRGVDFEVGPGEIVGLVGDNAAGKSTLMKVLSGVYAADAGEILIEGTPVRLASPMEARAAGIEMVYQDFALVPELSVTQNIFLGREMTRELLLLRFLNQPAMARLASELFGRLGLRVPPVDTPVRALSGGQQQAVAIARAIAFDARLVIMDEPTASLGATAIARVRETIGQLKTHGVAVVVISHRLEDVFTTADRVVVMKHGHVVGARAVADTAADEILHMIIAGNDPRRTIPPQPSA